MPKYGKFPVKSTGATLFLVTRLLSTPALTRGELGQNEDWG